MRRTLLAALLLTVAGCAPEGPTGFVTFNVPPDASCLFSPGSEVFIPIGLYDIAPGYNGLSDECRNSYVTHLVVNSFLRRNRDTDLGRAEPNYLALHSAEIRLMTVNKETILFDQEDPPLPNPFLVVTNNVLEPSSGTTPSQGIAAVETIPAAYASQLNNFAKDRQQILAEIQIFGTTTGDIDVDFKPFLYPIELCDGCLTFCESLLADEGLTTIDLEGICAAQGISGMDDRPCIDRSPDCG